MDKNSKVYQAALTLFSNYGLQKVNMQEIADASGVSKKTLYNHFNGKEDLFHKTMEWQVKSIISFYEKLCTDKTMNLVDKLTQSIQFAFSTLSYKSSLVFPDLLRHNPYLGASPIYHIRNNINLYISHLVTEAQAAGICRNDFSSDMIANSIVLLINGVLSWEDTGGDKKIKALELFDTALSLMIQSVLTEKGSQETSLADILKFNHN